MEPGAGNIQQQGGSKVFSLVGKIGNTGLIFVRCPWGYNPCAGLFSISVGVYQGGRQFKAVQTGGPPGAVFRPTT